MFLTEYAMLKYNYAFAVQYTDSDLAIVALNEALTKEPENQKLKVQLAESYLHGRKCKQATNIIEPTVLQNPHNEHLILLKLASLVCSGNYDKFKAQAKLYPKLKNILHLKVYTALKLKERERYLGLIDQLNQLKPKSLLLKVLKWNQLGFNENTKPEVLNYIKVCQSKAPRKIYKNDFYSCEFINQTNQFNFKQGQEVIYEE